MCSREARRRADGEARSPTLRRMTLHAAARSAVADHVVIRSLTTASKAVAAVSRSPVRISGAVEDWRRYAAASLLRLHYDQQARHAPYSTRTAGPTTDGFWIKRRPTSES